MFRSLLRPSSGCHPRIQTEYKHLIGAITLCYNNKGNLLPSKYTTYVSQNNNNNILIICCNILTNIVTSLDGNKLPIEYRQLHKISNLNHPMLCYVVNILSYPYGHIAVVQ